MIALTRREIRAKLIKYFNFEIPARLKIEDSKRLVKKLKISDVTLKRYLAELRKLSSCELVEEYQSTKTMREIRKYALGLRNAKVKIDTISLAIINNYNLAFSNREISNLISLEKKYLARLNN